MRVPASPPERVDLGDVVVRRLTVADAAAVANAVAENLEHLRPWMPWANLESADERFQRRRLVEADAAWARGADFGYGLFEGTGPDERLLGAFGLTARRGAKTLEIGYWMRADATRRGLATRAVEVLTNIAVDQPGVERVLVYCDEANHASAAIPRRLGYQLERVVSVPPEALAETGRQLEFVLRRAEWSERRATSRERDDSNAER
jgi:RimJ/RimL family protein N-acetyltransferase